MKKDKRTDTGKYYYPDIISKSAAEPGKDVRDIDGYNVSRAQAETGAADIRTEETGEMNTGTEDTGTALAGSVTDISSGLSIAARLAAAPGHLMCIITLGMLAADLMLPAMANLQYTVYPMLYRIQTLIAVLCCLIYIWIRRDAAGNSFLSDGPDLSAMMFMAFAVFMMISTCINGFSREAMFGVQFRYIGVFDLLIFIIVYMGLSSRTVIEGSANSVLWSIILTADAIDIALLLSIPTENLEAFENKEGLSAVFFHGNHFGYFLVIALILSAGYYIYGNILQMIAAVISMGLNFMMLVYNRSLGCLIAAAAVLVVMLLVSMVRGQGRRRSFILTIWIIAAAAAALVCSSLLRVELYFTFREAVLILQGKGNQYMGHGRWKLWELTAEYIRQRPLFGYGCEGINEMLFADSTAINGVSNPHCEPLTYAAFFGIPAALFYIGGCITAIAKGFRSSNNAAGTANCSFIAAYAAAAYFISSLFGVAMFYTAPFFFVLLGISAGAESSEGLFRRK